MPSNDATTKTLLTERKHLREGMRALVAAKYESSEMVKDGTYLVPDFTAEEQEQHDRYVKRWGEVEAELKILEGEKDKERIASEKADLVAGATVRTAHAKANADAFNNLIKVGQNKFVASKVPEKGHPGEWELPIPAIMKDADGINRVHPFPAIFSRNDDVADIEATYRNAEIIKAGMVGRYDPRTGNRLEADSADPVQINTTTDGSMPDLVVDLYRYMIARDDLAQYCTIYQTPGLNTLPITRRTEIPEAVIIGNNTNYGQNTAITDSQPVFDKIELKAFKYGRIVQHTYESAMSLQPWSVAAQIIEDGALALSNGFGQHVLNGAGGATQPLGILTAVKADSNQHITSTGAVASSAFTGASPTFKISDLINLVTALPIPYFKSPGRRLITGLPAWGSLLGVTDTNGQPIFNSDLDVNDMRLPKYNLRVALEPNMEAVAASNIPFIIGDLAGHVIRYAGGVRIEFSGEYGFANDLLSHRFILYGDAQQVDPNAFRGLEFS